MRKIRSSLALSKSQSLRKRSAPITMKRASEVAVVAEAVAEAAVEEGAEVVAEVLASLESEMMTTKFTIRVAMRINAFQPRLAVQPTRRRI
jgi:hypothetical protein